MFADGRPVLIDFDVSVFDAHSYSDRGGLPVMPRDNDGASLRTRLRRAIFGTNDQARHSCSEMIRLLEQRTERPRLLIVGGGAIGDGTSQFYVAPDLDVLSLDVYSSPNVHVIADAHQLPFADSSFDGVWVQAVLEHVLTPDAVVHEIHRVLRPDGLVYADTPFMWPVHEGAYDFTRYSVSGHRWLFRHFTLIRAGVGSGAGTAAVLSIRYLVRSIIGSDVISTLIAAPFFWLRYLDRFAHSRRNADAASGVYFFGAKSAQAIHAKSMVAFYDEQATSGRKQPSQPLVGDDISHRSVGQH